MAFSATIFVLDAAKTSGWTLPRQNLQSLRGAAGCGLAAELLAPAVESARALSANTRTRAVPKWLPALPVAGVARHVVGSIASGGDDATPWYRLVDRPTGLFVSNQTTTPLALEWSRVRGGAIEPLGRAPIAPVFVPLDSEAYLPWLFLPASELPQLPANADVVRIVVDGPTAAPGAVVGVSAPVTYDATRLSDRLDSATSTLIHPTTFTYFPCARQPAVGNGVVEAPSQVIVTDANPLTNPVLPGGRIGPYVGILDLYRLDRLALTDSANPPPDTVAYGVDTRIPGGLEARPDAISDAS
jgi:hypothetical protein